MKKIILIIFTVLLSIGVLFLFINKDKFVYVGPVTIVDIDCNKKAELLDIVYESDRRIRQPGSDIPLEQRVREDHRNQEWVISIIEKCGMPTLKEVNQNQMMAIWRGIQHTNKKYRKKYFPLIEEAVNRGDLPKEQYALMKDRILVDEGKPQLYGTQYKGNGQMFKLDSPDQVNERRKEMGMKPLENFSKTNN